jgi:ABC-2 type transport system ATP-binding protein
MMEGTAPVAPLVELRNVTLCYEGRIPAVSELTLTLEAGRIYGLLGPNGSGKTTLIKLLIGLLEPTAGTITIGGMPVGDVTKAHVSYLPDKPFLESGMKVEEAMTMYADFYEDFDMQRAEDMLERLRLSKGERLNRLSKGTLEKVQLILAMSRRADLYLLDEPMAGVDPAARDYILETIISNYDPHATILISTHLISDVEKMLDEVIMLQYGRLLHKASVEEMRMQRGESIDAIFRKEFKC